MTVIEGIKKCFVGPNSENSSLDGLDLARSSTTSESSIDNDTVYHSNIRNRSQINKILKIEDAIHMKKSSGKRKIRRFNNRCFLHTLEEEKDVEEDWNLIILVEATESPLKKLLNNPEALKFWNDFIDKFEEEQEEILNNAIPERYQNNNKNLQVINKNENNQELCALGRVTKRMKRIFKAKKNLQIEFVKDTENNLIEFFYDAPKDVYVDIPRSSFNRLILKAIAHYHGLQIKCITPSDTNSKHIIEIFNTKDNWVSAACSLAEFIEKLQ